MIRHNILVIDDEEFIRLNIQNVLQEDNNVILHDRGSSAIEAMKDNDISLVLLDLNLPDINGLEVLRQLRQLQPDLLVIIITGFASVESAVEAIKLGAYDYIKKPFKADALKLIVKLALETQDLKGRVRELQQLRPKTDLDMILGDCDAMALVKHRIVEFAKHDTETVLITGESGTGKELIAKALHSLSARGNQAFVDVNCASIPENLLESELFGYDKGAFTNAHKSKIGLFEKANKGTIFLDEIGEMSPALQAKLLRFLEQKRFRRLGGTSDISVDLRIIAATNKDLRQAIEEKSFREDLYYRLNVLRIEIPPLRERGSDVLMLAYFFLNFYSKKFKKKLFHISPEACSEIQRYSWPGNIRELKNMVERICILQGGDTVERLNLPVELPGGIVEKPLSAAHGSLGQLSLDEILHQKEYELIKQAMEAAGNNTSQAARILRIPRETLRYKLSKFSIGNGEN